MLRTVQIFPDQSQYDEITALLPSIFPPEELAPHDAIGEKVPYLCFYEEESFIGFSQVLKMPELHYLCYMAMLPEHRSKGYGGQMLELILVQRGGLPLALDIEVPDERAANYEQRVRRHRFYLKHGLVDTGYVYEYNGTPFLLMSTGEEGVPALLRQYCSAHPECTSGKVRIYKMESGGGKTF